MRRLFSSITSKFLSLFGYEEYEEEYEESYNDRIVDFNSSRVNEIIIGKIASFENAREVTDNLRKKKTVIIDLADIEKNEAKRIIDFICGTTYALNGDMYKIGESIFIFTPSSVKVNSCKFEEYSRISTQIEIEKSVGVV